MSKKLLALFILSIFAGLCFIGAGIYFLSKKFLTKLIDSSIIADDDIEQKMCFRAKGSGYTAIALGSLTLFWGLIVLLFPELVSILAVIYMAFLIIAFSIISFVFK